MSATRSFRLGYSIITWGGTPDLDQALGAIAGAGWEGAEFTGTSLEWLGTPRHLRSVFERYELPLVCMFGGVNLENDPVHIEKQRRRIEFAGEMGCEVFCLLGAPRVHQRLPTDDEFKRLAEQAETFIDHAEPYGLKVAYHAHPRCTVESEEEQDELLSYADRLQVCVDVSVAALMGEDDAGRGGGLLRSGDAGAAGEGTARPVVILSFDRLREYRGRVAMVDD